MNTTIRELNFIRISSRARCSRRPTVTGNSIGRFVVDGIRWLRPLRRSRPLRILPRSHVTKLTSALTRARPTELFRKVLRRHLAQQISLIATSQNVNFLHRHRIEEALDHTEHRREAPRRVDQVQLAQTLGVVVLRDGRGLLDVAVDGTDFADAHALEVHDRAAGFEQGAGFARAAGEAGVGDFFVFHDQVLQHAFGRRDFVHGGQIDLAELFDVDGSSVLGEGQCG